MKTRDVTVDGIRLHVAEEGDGPALVLLHGLTATHYNWERTVPAFSDRFRVIVPDLPGHGRSAKPDAPYTIDFYAGVIRSLGRALGVGEAVVVGNSLGGQIGLELAISYPLWTRALVLAAPAGGFSTALRVFGPVIGAGAHPSLLRSILPRSLARSFYDSACPDYEARRTILAERLAHDDYPAFARAVGRSVAGALAADQDLARITQPTLLVWGADDAIVALRGSRRLVRALPQARLHVFERCGHLPMLEHPEKFNALVDDFLRTLDDAPRADAAGMGR
jgi:pimeloyl-ACP methyl ester carboxylesterase